MTLPAGSVWTTDPSSRVVRVVPSGRSSEVPPVTSVGESSSKLMVVLEEGSVDVGAVEAGAVEAGAVEAGAGAAASGPEWRGSVNPGSSAAGAWRPASASSQGEAPPGDAAPSSGPDVGPDVGPRVSPGVPCPPELDQAGPDPAPMPLSRPSLAPGRDSPGRSVLPVPVVGLASGRVSPPDPAATPRPPRPRSPVSPGTRPSVENTPSPLTMPRTEPPGASISGVRA